MWKVGALLLQRIDDKVCSESPFGLPFYQKIERFFYTAVMSCRISLQIFFMNLVYSKNEKPVCAISSRASFLKRYHYFSTTSFIYRKSQMAKIGGIEVYTKWPVPLEVMTLC